ncbi:MAG: hypothetical protein ACM31P_07035 [Actinomycetota bacterium]
MNRFQSFDTMLLNGAGLNLQAVFNISDLPSDVAESLRSFGALEDYGQLILIGHGGTRLWECVKESGIISEDPIDDFTVQMVKRWFSDSQPNNRFRIIYPGSQAIGLQRLGQLAGWHSSSPFRVGVDAEWGSWYAYRAVVLADTRFEPTRPVERTSPCLTCDGRPCVAACPAQALAGNEFGFEKCAAYRLQPESACRDKCLARVGCPVGSSHRYSDEQLRHSYSRSLRYLKQYF